MSSPKWTKEQQAVIDNRGGNLLVAAAAGSGKTAVLVERIIQMILDKKNPVDIDKLLVVTFTNAAASEMRERIGDAIAKTLDKEPDNTHLQKQLILLNKASITTIHSFCLEVIKSNFHKINLDPNFRIGDTTECTLLKQEAIEEVFEELYEEVDKGFLNLVHSYAEKGGDTKLQDIILNIFNFAMSSPNPELWLEEAYEKLYVDECFEFGASIWARAILENVELELSGLELSMENSLEEISYYKFDEEYNLESYIQKYENDYNTLKSILEACDFSWEEAEEVIKRSVFENYQKGSKPKLKEATEEVIALKNTCDDLRKKAKETIKDMASTIFKRDNEMLIEEFRHLFGVAKSISETVLKFNDVYSAKKREKGIIDFNDIEHFALKILVGRDEDGLIVPTDIAKDYRDKFHEIFIDEYQDSNYVQESLLSIISKLDTPNRFMVGDVKQSIYRFRQAKPEIFLDKYRRYNTEEGSLNRKIMLYKNFRSRKEVVDSANYIFENTMSAQIGEIEYNEDEKLNLGAFFKENEDENVIVGGETEIHLVQTKENTSKEEKKSSQEEETDEENAEEEIDNIQLEARLVGKVIKELMSPKEDGKIQMVYDKNLDSYRPVQFKDIVILMRATSTPAPVFAEELMNMNIPTYADTGVGYFDTIEIQTIMSLLRVIDNPLQDIPLASILRSPIYGFTPEEMIDIRLCDNQKTMYDALKLMSEVDDLLGAKCLDLVNKIHEYKEKSMYMSTDEFLWYLYMQTGYYAYCGALPGGYQRQANLKILFERAKQFESTSFKGIFNFINFINKLKKSNTDMSSAKTLGENANVVRIMSIHKSKGLEFPVVICATMGKQFNKQDFQKDILYHHDLGYGPQFVDHNRKISYPSMAKEALKTKINIENLSEEMRVLYVAFTRPKEKLIITGISKDLEKSMKAWASGVISNEPISKYKILKGKSFLDWIMPTVLKHKDLDDIKNQYNIDLSPDINTESKWKTKLWYKEDIVVDKLDKETESIRKILENLDLENPQTEYYETIKNILSHKYKDEIFTKKPSSISVTEIKKIQSRQEEDYSEEMYKPKITLKKPKFMETSDKIDASQKGTLTHLVMEILDTKKIANEEEIKEQIQEFIQKGILTSEEAKVLNTYAIHKFFKSEIGQRMLKSKVVRKEQAIYSRLALKDIYEQEFKDIQTDESVMLRGIIDAYFEEDGEIVIVDYKTDYVTQDTKDEVSKRYKVQLDLYQEAVEKITGKKVKEKHIYLFGINDSVKI